MHPLSFPHFLKIFNTAQGIQGEREVSKVRAQDFDGAVRGRGEIFCFSFKFVYRFAFPDMYSFWRGSGVELVVLA